MYNCGAMLNNHNVGRTIEVIKLDKAWIGKIGTHFWILKKGKVLRFFFHFCFLLEFVQYAWGK